MIDKSEVMNVTPNIILLELLMISKGLGHQYPTLFYIYLCVGLKTWRKLEYLLHHHVSYFFSIEFEFQNQWNLNFIQ